MDLASAARRLASAGIGVGHWTDGEARTGCTVITLAGGTVASGEIRGGAPATREFGLLDPLASVQTVDAVVLSGGSAFGLAAADGAVAALEAAGRGFETTLGRIPIVVGMSLYDLGVGRADVRPTAKNGNEAASQALGSEVGALVGPVGAGAGATSGKWGGKTTVMDSGLGFAMVEVGEAWIAALVAVNSFGFVSSETPHFVSAPQPPAIGENTTLGVILTNATADKAMCHRLAQAGHDGFARAIFPAHTAVDGDAVVAAATGNAAVNPMHLRAAAELVMAQAILSTCPTEVPA